MTYDEVFQANDSPVPEDPRLASVHREFPFEVGKLPVTGPDNMHTGFYGLFRSDTGAVVRSSSVSRVYQPHTSADVLALAEAALTTFPGASGEFSVDFNGGHCLSFAPGRDHRTSIFGTRDNIWPRINIRAMYDGRPVRANLGLFRDACSNLAEVKQVQRCNVVIRHDGGLRDKMDRLIEQFQGLADGWVNLQEWALGLEEKRLSLRDFVGELYGQPPTDATDRTRTSWDDRAMKILARVRSERYDTGRPDPDLDAEWTVSGWEAWNSITGYHIHDIRRKGDVGQLRRAFLASEEPAVQKAEEMLTALAV